MSTPSNTERLLLQCPNLESVHASDCQGMLVKTIETQVGDAKHWLSIFNFLPFYMFCLLKKLVFFYIEFQRCLTVTFLLWSQWIISFWNKTDLLLSGLIVQFSPFLSTYYTDWTLIRLSNSIGTEFSWHISELSCAITLNLCDSLQVTRDSTSEGHFPLKRLPDGSKRVRAQYFSPQVIFYPLKVVIRKWELCSRTT